MMRDPYDFTMNTLVPMVVEQTNRGAGLRHLFPPPEGADHLPRRPRQRCGVEPRLRAAPVPRVRESEQGHRALHQLSGRRGDLGPGDVRHHAVHPPRGDDAVHRPGGLDGVAAADGRRQGQAVCPAQCANHDPPAVGRRPGQATDIEIHAREILAIRARLNEIYVKHTGQPLDVIERAMERDKFLTPSKPRNSASSTKSSPAGRPRRGWPPGLTGRVRPGYGRAAAYPGSGSRGWGS